MLAPLYVFFDLFHDFEQNILLCFGVSINKDFSHMSLLLGSHENVLNQYFKLFIKSFCRV